MLLEEGVCYDQCVLLAKLFTFDLLRFVLQVVVVLLPTTPGISTSYFCIPVPYNEKDIFFWLLVLEGLVDLYRTIKLLLLQYYWSGHRLG